MCFKRPEGFSSESARRNAVYHYLQDRGSGRKKGFRGLGFMGLGFRGLGFRVRMLALNAKPSTGRLHGAAREGKRSYVGCSHNTSFALKCFPEHRYVVNVVPLK